MRLILFLFCTFLLNDLTAQSNKFAWNIEFAPYLSTSTSNKIDKLSDIKDFKPSYDVQANIFYNIHEKMSINVGGGFLNTGYRLIQNVTKLPIVQTELIYNYQYFKIPVGLKYTFNESQFFIHPMLNINFFHDDKLEAINHFENGDIEDTSPLTDDKLRPPSPVVYQLSLNIGRTFLMDKHQFSAGLKTYYTLHPVLKSSENKLYGVGLFLSYGLKNG